MKAIQIKYLSATNTKPARLKAWTSAGQIIVSVDNTIEINVNAEMLAIHYAEIKFGTPKISGFGSLPNGDWCATFGDI